MADFKPYSFDPMQDSSESEEDEGHEGENECQSGSASWCALEVQQEKECLRCKDIEEAVNKIISSE